MSSNYHSVSGGTLDNSVCKEGLLKKCRPKPRPKYFVLHKDGSEQSARLEYYDSKKNWDNKKKPKKIIYLKTCFSINAFSDTKINHGMTLYTKDDSFQVSFDSEEERDSWLMTIKALISTHRDARPMFQHVWNVKIRDRGLGKAHEGDYRLCLNGRTVILVKKTCVDPHLIFPLEVIRRCGHTDIFFNLEVGRQASTGPGEFWMEVDDTLIAQNVHYAILAVMNKPKEEEDFRSKSGSHSSKDRFTFGSKSGTASAESSRPRSSTGQRSKNAPSLASHQSDNTSVRGRSDSMDSRSTMTAGGITRSDTISSVNSTNSVPARSIDNIDTQSIDSSCNMSQRSLTPDIRLTDAPAGSLYLPMDMTKSLSQTSVGSQHKSAEPVSSYADMTCNVPAQAVRHNSLNFRPDKRSTSITDASQPKHRHVLDTSSQSDNENYWSMTVEPNKAPALGGRKPNRTQSYFSSATDNNSPTELASPSNDKSSSYLEMSPSNQSATQSQDCVQSILPGAHAGSLFQDVSVSNAMLSSHEDPYLAMSPAALETPEADPYLDMAPASNMPLTQPDMSLASNMPSKRLDDMATDQYQDPYLEMTPPPRTSATPKIAVLPSDPIVSPYFDMAPLGSSLPNEPSNVSTSNRGLATDDPYLDMGPQNSSMGSIDKTGPLNAYLDMGPGKYDSSKPIESAYMEMKPAKSVDNGSLNSLQLSSGVDRCLDDKNPYIDMTGNAAHKASSSIKDDVKRHSSHDNPAGCLPLRHYSVGSKPAVHKPLIPDQYVEMRRAKDLTDKEKSLSVPHLMPLSLASNPDLTHLQDELSSHQPSKHDALMLLGYDRPRTSSESFTHRPRGASWSQNTRPRSSSHGQKQKPVKMISKGSAGSRESIQSSCSEYIDMKVGPASHDAYVEMSSKDSNLHLQGRSSSTGSRQGATKHSRKNSQPGTAPGGIPEHPQPMFKLSPPKPITRHSQKSNSFDGHLDTNPAGEYVDFLQDDSTRNSQPAMIVRRMSQPQHINPFPELSASSEEDVSMRSVASSFSSTKSSSSSRSSLARGDEPRTSYSFGSQLEPEAYVDCQQVAVRVSPLQYDNKPATTMMTRPIRVASFISEEPLQQPKPEPVEKRKSRKSAGGSTRKLATAAIAQVPPGNGADVRKSSPTPPQPNTVSREQTTPGIVDQYFDMSPVTQTRPPGIKSNNTVTNVSTSSLNDTSSAISHVISPSPSAPRTASGNKDPTPESLIAESHIAESLIDPYMHLTISQPKSTREPSRELPLPLVSSASIPISTSNMTSTSAPAAATLFEDPYLVMNSPDCRIGLVPLHTLNALPVADGSPVDSGSQSDISIIASSEVTRSITGTGSSGESNNTLHEDDYTQMENKTSVNTQRSMMPGAKRLMKSVPCYIRNNSRDVNIFASPSKPVPSYIRSDSNRSTLSEGYEDLLSPSVVTHSDDIISQIIASTFVSAAAQNESGVDNYQTMDYTSSASENTMACNTSSLKQTDTTDPISPIRLPTVDKQSAFSALHRNHSVPDDIPGSAAELELQQKKLEQVAEESNAIRSFIIDDSKPLTSAGSKSMVVPKTPIPTDGQPSAPISFILDEKPAASSTDRPRKPPTLPPLQKRAVSIEGKTKRHSSGADTPSDVAQPLNYVTIKHDENVTVANPCASPKSDAPQPKPSVDYTKIDFQKTEKLKSSARQ